MRASCASSSICLPQLQVAAGTLWQSTTWFKMTTKASVLYTVRAQAGVAARRAFFSIDCEARQIEPRDHQFAQNQRCSVVRFELDDP
mmetsp:Transcript_7624/g.20244  ORF Transcript_7624/g.20244 Transcript_7624/m.20244 type:complete len:87 (-) Transcript_7624:697-957(-)